MARKKPTPPQLDIGSDRVTCVAGLDTASNRWHLWCDPPGAPVKYICPAEKPPNPDNRRQQLYETAHAAFALLPRGTLLVVEEPLALKNGKTTRLLSLAAGAIWAAHLDFDISWTWADVSHWKKIVIGNGNADKDQIAAWVTEHMDLSWTDKDDADFYDAAALCYYGQMALGLVPRHCANCNSSMSEAGSLLVCTTCGGNEPR